MILASFKCLGLGAGLLLAVSFVHAASAQTPSPPSLHAFAEVSLSPSGALIASVETDQPLAPTTKRPRGPVVVRDRLTGAVVATYDPCPACRYVQREFMRRYQLSDNPA